ncbi:MAG: ATP-binding protein, partial [Nitrospira sp.]|nr:ATP-binding protein [Nitrospira sp.]
DAMGKRKGEGGKISLKTKFDAEGKSILVEVEDTGIGISPEILPYVFQKPIPTKSGAHGFDLLITKRIVDQHGGTIEIDSKPSQGTVVKVKFPVPG